MSGIQRAFEWCRSTERRQWWSALLAFLALALCWSVATPLFAAPDEPAHVVRAASLARGQILGESAPGTRDKPSRPLVVEVPEIFKSAKGVDCVRGRPQSTAECIAFFGSGRVTKVETTAGRHPPSYYAIVGLPSLPFASGFGVRLMRLLSAILTAAFMASAFASIMRIRASRLAGVGLAVATTPMVLFLGGTVNPSAPEIAAAICLWTTGLVVIDSTSAVDQRLVARLGVAASGLALIRQLGPLWLTLVGLTLIGVAGLRRTRTLLLLRSVQIAVLAAGVSCVLQVAWVAATGTLDPSNANSVGMDDSNDVTLRRTVGRTFEFWLQSIGNFGWLDTSPTRWVWFMWTVAIGMVAVLGILLANRRIVIAMLTTAVLTWSIPIVFESLNAQEAGYFWQGRYTLPLAVGVPILAGVGAAQRSRAPRIDLRPLSWCVGIALGAAQLLAFGQAIRRYAVGAKGSLNFFTGAAWAPPIAAAPLMLLFIAALVAWYGLILGASADEGR